MPTERLVARRLALLVAWVALATAAVELILRGVQKFVLGRIISVSRDVVWMAPIADLVLFGTAALVLALISLAAPRLGSLRSAITVFAFLAAFGVLTMQPWMTWWAMLALALGFGYQTGAFAASREALLWRVVRRSLPVVMVAFVALPIGQRWSAAAAERGALATAPSSPPRVPNVLVIVWDAVRARDLSLHGYPRPTSPRLAALAAGGVTFDRAYAPSSYTMPTHASLFTGLWPHQFSASWAESLDASMPTLAEVLGNRGYRTGAFSANSIYVTWEHGLLRGFGHVDDYGTSAGEIARGSALLKWLLDFDQMRLLIGRYDLPGRRDAAHVQASFLRWLDRGDGSQPFFAFLNVFDAHGPYLPQAPYDTLFAPAGTGSEEHARVRRATVAERGYLMGPASLARQQDLYDGAIAWLDHNLGLLLDTLEQRGVLRNTLVVVLGDHGEAFMEHRTFGHGNDVYTEVIQVPMVMTLPGRVPAGVRVPGVASVRDVPATILSLAGASEGPAPLPGRSLARFWTTASAGPTPSDTVMAEIDRLPHGERDWYPVRRGNVRSIIAGPYQLITVGTEVELYDLVSDPDQRQNLAGRPEHATTRASLLAALRDKRRDAVPAKQ
jgi:arylsulfatase A-like enzyme